MFLVQFLNKINNELSRLDFDVNTFLISVVRPLFCQYPVQICHNYKYVFSVRQTRPWRACANSANSVIMVRRILAYSGNLTGGVKAWVNKISQKLTICSFLLSLWLDCCLTLSWRWGCKFACVYWVASEWVKILGWFGNWVLILTQSDVWKGSAHLDNALGWSIDQPLFKEWRK